MPSFRALSLLALGGFTTACPGDDVPVGDDTGGPATTTGMSSSSTSATTTGVTSSTTTESEESSSSGPPIDTETDGSSSTTNDDTTTTSDDTTGSSSGDPSSSSSSPEESSSSTGDPPDQDCPYGTLMVPDSISDTTLGEDSEFSSSCGGNGAPDISYTLTAPTDGVYFFDTFGSSIDTILAVYDGDCGGMLLGCNNDDAVQAPDSSLSVNLTAGQTVTVVVDGFAVMGGAVTLNVAYYEGTCPNGDLGNTVPQMSSGSTAGSDNTLFGSCGGSTANDDAFTFVAPEGGIYTFDTAGSDFDTVLYVRDACFGNELVCNDNGPVDQTSSASVTLAQDDEVVVVVDGVGLESGNYNINVDLDVCPDADLGNTVPQTAMGSTVGGIDQAVGSCSTNGGSPDVAYTFTAPETNTYVFDTEGSGFDTRLYVIDGASCVGDELACDDDSGTGVNSLLAVDLVADQQVTVVVDGFNGQSGSYNLNVTAPVCGNGVLDAFEACEGAMLGGQTCMTQGFAGGVLACDANCMFDLSGCNSCGDNVVNGVDACDGYALDEMSCEDLGFVGGTLDCDGDCAAFDETECSNSVIAVCSAAPAAINDVSTMMNTIAVADMGTITDVDVFLDITHTYCADMDISLAADDLGLTNNLSFDGCGGNNDAWIFFNDEGNGAVGVSCVEPNALEGNVIPQQLLSVYDGGEANGDWTLTITDDLGGDVGTLNQWCLYFTVL